MSLYRGHVKGWIQAIQGKLVWFLLELITRLDLFCEPKGTIICFEKGQWKWDIGHISVKNFNQITYHTRSCHYIFILHSVCLKHDNICTYLKASINSKEINQISLETTSISQFKPFRKQNLDVNALQSGQWEEKLGNQWENLHKTYTQKISRDFSLNQS